MNLVITPTYRSFDVIKQMVERIDSNSFYPFLHVLVDDDSGIDDPFPVKASANRRILLMKRDYSGVIHKNGSAQAMQLAYDWATQGFINEKPNPVTYDHIFLVEADVLVKESWDKKLIELSETLPEDWLTLDVKSVDFEEKPVRPMDNTPILGLEREDLEITLFPDFETTLFNNKIFEAGIKFSSFESHFDTAFGRTTSEIFGGKHYRSKTLSAYHLVSQSTKFLTEIPIVHDLKLPILSCPYRSPLVVVELIKDVIKDKVVCDLGCAYGDLMMEMKKYAKEVIGIEIDKSMAIGAKQRGLKVVEGDVTSDTIPEADVYYLWINSWKVEPIVKCINKGIIIFGTDTAVQEEFTAVQDLNLKGEWREVNYHEGDDFRQWGLFKVFIAQI